MKVCSVALPDGGMLTGCLHDLSDSRGLCGYDVRPAVLIIPGGAYEHCSTREGEPVALRFLAAGYQAFVLHYATGEHAGNWRPLRQAAAAVLYLRQNAGELHLDPKKIALCGFSAGGHLAAATTFLCDAPQMAAALAAPAEQLRPNALVLGYPVISMGAYTHAVTRDNVTGGDAALCETFSLEKQVKPGLPPVFLWHTVTDGSVPVENSLLLAGALRANGVPFELHLFAGGHHGMSLCTPEVGENDPHNAHWLPLCLEWLDRLFDFTA